MQENIPLCEFDPVRPAIIEPEEFIGLRDLPEHCVFCYFREVIRSTQDELAFESRDEVRSEGENTPIRIVQYQGKEVAIVPAPVGAPRAALVLEAVIARGVRKIIACGSAGVLEPGIGSGEVIVPTSAVRDEGTSYHYLPPSREVQPTDLALQSLFNVLEEQQIPHRRGKTWTTDAFYRETPGKVARRKQEGCIAVDMEAAAFFAVSRFRDVEMAQLLYGGDDVSGKEWDRRELGKPISARELLFRLSLDACVAL